MADKTPFPKIRNLVQLYDLLTGEERIIVDVLRQIIKETLPAYCKEKISYNVPFFYGNRSICLVWPASVPRGGIKTGVLLGFWYGNRLKDVDQYLTHGTNKQIFYKIYQTAEQIDEAAIIKLLKEAAVLDAMFSKRK
ncbi:MAG: DUF1801 domain-containing protein [Sphingobacteriales bacterium]|nr:DUF1801 domain-containing protein [Sphingobacteriales bacterium]MBI3719775.1 DUF1801 domain-containing protein [Sphingobacteriales bacterium]